MAARHTLITVKRAHTFDLRSDRQIGGLPDASSAMRNATSRIAVPFVHCCNACCDSNPGKPFKDHQGDKFLSFPLRKLAKAPPGAFNLLGGSPKTNVTPVGCAVGPPITGQLTLEGIPVLGLVDTGALVTCLRFAIWWCYHAQWGPLKQFEGTVHGAHSKPLQIAGKNQHLDIQWGEARGRASFIVIVGLESPPCFIGMDIMRPLRVHIDVINGTVTPAQPDPQTVHLNAAQSQQQRKKIPLPGTELATLETASPHQSQQQWEKKPLLEVDSPAVGAASPPQSSQQRKEMALPKTYPLTMGAADSFQTQPQRREMPLPGAEISAPPIVETSPLAASATALPSESPSNASLSTA